MRRRALDLVSVPTVITAYVATIIIIGYVVLHLAGLGLAALT